MTVREILPGWISPPGEYQDHTLLTTLESCLLCTAALRMDAHVGRSPVAAQYLADLPGPMAAAQRLVEGGHLTKLRKVSLVDAFQVTESLAAP